MNNLAIAWDAANARADWQLLPGGLATGQSLEAAVWVSLFSDRRSGTDDAADRRGWWADAYAERPIGSRMWTLTRAKATTETPRRARDFIVEALQWLVDDGVAAGIDVTAQWVRRGFLGATVQIRQRSGSVVALSYAWAWGEIGQPVHTATNLLTLPPT